MTLSDKFLVAFVVGWLVSSGIFWYKHMYGMSILWLEILGSVAAIEAISYMYTGMTVTNHFKAFVQHDPGMGHFLIVLMILTWFCLMIHFGIPKK